MCTLRPTFIVLAASFLAMLFTGGVGAQPRPSATATPSRTAAASEGTFLKTLSRAPDASTDWQPLRDRYTRFSLAVPADWTEGVYPADQAGLLYALVVCESSPRDGFSTNLVVSQTQAPPDFVMKSDMVAPIARKMTQEMKSYGYAVREKAFTRVDGLPCVIVGGTLEVDGRLLRNLQLRVVHRGLNYLFTFTTLDRQYAQYEGLFARIVRAVVFERELAPPSPSGTASPSPSPHR